MRKCTNMLVSMLGAASLTFALALTGCGQAADTGSADTEETTEAEATTEDEATAEDEAAGTEDTITLEIPEELSGITRAPGELMGVETDELETTDLAELPEGEEESVAEDKETVDEDSGDASKAPANSKAVTFGGMSFYMPNSWQGQKAGDEFIMVSPDGGVVGCLQAVSVPSGSSYDLIAMCEAIPYGLQNQGCTDISVTDYGTGTSSSGKMVDAFIQVEFNAEGTHFVAYYEYLQSKSYITYLALLGDVSSWNKNVEGAALIVNTVSFANGQAI